jgi:hypothetical protein
MISIFKHYKRVNYKVTDVLYADIRFLYIHQGLR